MPNKIKFFLFALMVLAVLSTYGLVQSFRSADSRRVAGTQKSGLDFSVDPDKDNDGLSDSDESYWNTDFQNPDTDGDGFKDGEEISSGHDPRIAGPNDLLSGVSGQNITKRASSLIAAGLAEGSLKPDSPNFDKSINQIVNDIIYQSLLNQSTYSSGNQIIAAPDSDPQTETTYLELMTPLVSDMRANLPQGFIDVINQLQTVNQTNNPKDEKFISLIDREVEKLENYADQLSILPVPPNWQQQHEHLLVLLRSGVQNYKLFQKMGDDAIQATTALVTLGFDFMNNIPGALLPYVQRETSAQIQAQIKSYLPPQQ